MGSAPDPHHGQGMIHYGQSLNRGAQNPSQDSMQSQYQNIQDSMQSQSQYQNQIQQSMPYLGQQSVMDESWNEWMLRDMFHRNSEAPASPAPIKEEPPQGIRRMRSEIEDGEKSAEGEG